MRLWVTEIAGAFQGGVCEVPFFGMVYKNPYN